MTETTGYRGILEYVLKTIGRAQLAKQLRVGEELVQEWLEGKADMSPRHQLALADLVQTLTMPPIR
jgi:hypothetical protein